MIDYTLLNGKHKNKNPPLSNDDQAEVSSQRNSIFIVHNSHPKHPDWSQLKIVCQRIPQVES